MITTQHNNMADSGNIFSAWTCWKRPKWRYNENWQCRALPADRPLYGLDRLAANPTGLVVITEGEKCADVVSDLPDVVSMTWSGGTKDVNKTDWSPLVARSVIVWPDADEAGMSAASAIIETLKRAGANQIRRIDLGELERRRGQGALPGGFDVADLVAEGFDAKWVTELLLTAPLA
ncbi:MAG: hypothetical protein H0W83_18415 [Planctomycetes bacterium]|nr:hypothetical protein [Planctomycetota bacterium]